MSVKVLYFAGLKEALGKSGETLELPAGVAFGYDGLEFEW